MFIDKIFNNNIAPKIPGDVVINKDDFSGIYKIKIEGISFYALVIGGDDTSILERFKNANFYDFTFNQWCKWSKNPGIYIDVGAHTGLYTLASLKSSNKNHVISIEPLPINYYRILTNIRLNKLHQEDRFTNLNYAAGEENKIVKFMKLSSETYTSKGGRISSEGIKTKQIMLDSISINLPNLEVKGIKIDTEGNDLNVLQGSVKLIKKYYPKIIVETRKENAEQIYKFISEMGYKNIYTKEKFISVDSPIIFESNEKVKDLFCEFSLE